MWYLIWFLGTFLASCLAIIAGIWLEQRDAEKGKK